MYIYHNSKFIKDTEATISPFDHGFLYGLGVFETFRVYEGFPFLLHDHLDRLQLAVDEIGISYKINRQEIFEIIQELIALNHCESEDVTVRLNISAGNGEVGQLLQTYDHPTLLCFLRKAPSAAMIEKKAIILKLRRNTPEGKYRLKSHHYLNNILGKRELIQTPDLDGIFLNEQGFVAEGIVSNIFWGDENGVYTPSLETGILNGITRKFVIRCLETLQIPVVEGFFKKEQMFDSHEVIMTNSSQELIAIRDIDGHEFEGENGIIIQKLYDLYKNNRTKLLSIDELQRVEKDEASDNETSAN
ncbi:aminodeoxychorismate lyase [Metabacillus niabensis]|uniref:aminodeoxychorismate lyase n=1 Tax=Metabacillus niabensis TaxID=324854 RepID=UPI001CF9A056|nr:aminodeoxychorismate lyase [Metabacillus niabensis]